ncbi:MAG: hypothetical protein V4642_05595 [Bacteroidota bacterium]
MKFLICTLLIVMAGCSKIPVEPEIDGYPVIKYQGFSNNEYGGREYTFQLLKDGDEGALYFSGYSKESPIYSIKVKTADGWKEEFLGWCGTGLENINIQDLPNATLLSIYHHEDSQPWKLGITFYKKVAGETDWQNGVTIWSDAVPAK